MANTDAYQDAVTKLMNYLNDTVVFAKSQLPDVAQQMLVYGAELTHFWMWFWIVGFALSFLMFLVSLLTMDEAGGVGVAMFLIMLGLGVLAGIEYSTIIEIRDAPKLYILDELASKLKATK
jgi:hypothetical protein